MTANQGFDALFAYSIRALFVLLVLIVLIELLRPYLRRKTTDDAKRQERFSAAAETAWDRRREEILSELASSSDPVWTGVYYYGDGLGTNATLTIAPTRGFVFLWTGCLGVYDRNFGDVTISEDGIVQLSCEFENDPSDCGVAPELIPVAWGDRRYLVPANNVTRFRRDVKGKREPRPCPHGAYFLRRGDHQKVVTGSPKLPPPPKGLRRFL